MKIIQIISAQPGWVAEIKDGKERLPVVGWALVEGGEDQQNKPGGIEGTTQAVIGLVARKGGTIQDAEGFTGFKGYSQKSVFYERAPGDLGIS